MNVELRDVGGFATYSGVKTGDLFIQQRNGATVLTFRVEDKEGATDLLLAASGPFTVGAKTYEPADLPTWTNPGDQGAGLPYRLLDGELVVRPRGLLQQFPSSIAGALLVDDKGPCLGMVWEVGGRSAQAAFDLKTGRQRFPEQPFAYTSWEILVTDERGALRTLFAFGS